MSNIYKFFRIHWKPIIFSISIVIFLVIFRFLLINKISSFDQVVYNLVSYKQNTFLTYFFIFISFLCSVEFIFTLTVLIMIFYKNKKVAFYIALNVLLCVILNQAIKYSVCRVRPLGINLIIEKGYSFPSGHSMVSLAFYGFIFYLLFHSDITKKKRIMYFLLFSLLVLLVGISRIYLGVHYASDVFAGFALSLAYLILFINFAYKKIRSS